MNIIIVSLVAVAAVVSAHPAYDTGVQHVPSHQPHSHPQPHPNPQPQPGSWTEWGMWSHCSATCGMGYQHRMRHCTPSQQQGGQSGSSLSSILPLLLLGGSGGSSSSALLPLLLGGGMGSSGSGGMNPLLLMSLLSSSSSSSSSNDTSSTDSTLPLLMMLMGQGGNGGGMDPLTMMLLLGSASSSSSTNSTSSSSSGIDPLILLLGGDGLFGQGGQQESGCIGSSIMKKDCRIADCTTLPPMTVTMPPVNCLSNWGQWGACSASCGNGLRTRSRTCRCHNNNHYGHGCNGPLTETNYCFYQACATPPITLPPTPPPTQPSVQDSWGPWTPFSSCQQKSNAGCYKTRTRTCKYGKSCTGPFEHSIHCECAVDQCSVPATSRKTCGYDGITKEYCEGMNCCFSDYSTDPVRCYEKA